MEDRLFAIKNVQLYFEGGIQEFGNILIENSKISKISMGDIGEDRGIDGTLDGNGLKAIPGFIDLHIHGVNGADVMDATPEALDIMTSALPAEGTTGFLATTITQSPEQIEKALENAGLYESKIGYAEVLGIHLEGPYISVNKAGAQPKEYIVKPVIDQFDRWQQLAGGKIKQVTLAPEQDKDGLFIKY